MPTKHSKVWTESLYAKVFLGIINPWKLLWKKVQFGEEIALDGELHLKDL